jgi:hypothetical protein
VGAENSVSRRGFASKGEALQALEIELERLTDHSDALSQPQNMEICSALRDRTPSGIRVRDERVTGGESRRSFAPESATTVAILQVVFYGSDGTRTRDLRRDRPVMALPG